MKYHNRFTIFNDKTYHSRLEAEYASFLLLREKAGEIEKVEEQKKIVFFLNGKKIFTYIADFYFFDKQQNKTRIIDVKGLETPIFRLKRKIIEEAYNISIEVIRKGEFK